MHARLNDAALSVAVLLFLAASNALAAADTLVVPLADGTFAPGLAKVWNQRGDAVVLELAPGVSADALAKALAPRLLAVQISVEADALVIRGLAFLFVGHGVQFAPYLVLRARTSVGMRG